jgi:hypothetical protein
LFRLCSYHQTKQLQEYATMGKGLNNSSNRLTPTQWGAVAAAGTIGMTAGGPIAAAGAAGGTAIGCVVSNAMGWQENGQNPDKKSDKE